jgi:hypothetical protein
LRKNQTGNNIKTKLNKFEQELLRA